MPNADPRPAATVVVLRAGADADVEVLLVRRNDNVAFMAGAYVFPGGRVDDSDREQAQSLTPVGPSSRFADLKPSDELAYRVAAVREVREEANLEIAVGDLVPFAHWVTPEIETRRYDTRFFLTRMPEGQTARHDNEEMTELEWLPPAEAIARGARGDILLPPPTWTTLKQLARFSSLGQAIEWARTKSIVRVQPGFIKDDAQTLLTLPGDPLHPTVPGWEIPEDTRFVLEQGKRWKPVRA